MTAGSAPGSIIAPIIAIHRAANDPNVPRSVATPMSIPIICRTDTTQHAAATTSVAATTTVVALTLGFAVLVTTASVVLCSATKAETFRRSGMAILRLPRVRRGRPARGSIEVVGQGLQRPVPVARERRQELLC